MLGWKSYKIKARECDGVVVLELCGNIVGGNGSKESSEFVDYVLSGDNRMILLDLHKVRRIDNQGLATLIGACNAAWQGRGELKFLQPSPGVLESLDSLLLTAFVDVYDDEKEAMAGFKQWLFNSRLHSAGRRRGNAKAGRGPLTRRSERLALVAPVLVGWENGKGDYVSERAETAVVSAHGALLRMQEELRNQQLVELSRDNEIEALARVVSTGIRAAAGWTPVAIELAKPSEMFWVETVTDRSGGGDQPTRSDLEVPQTHFQGKLPGPGALEKVARKSKSAYGFAHALKTKYPETQAFQTQDLLQEILATHPQLVDQFPWLSYPLARVFPRRRGASRVSVG
jgi:anti-sigma B factor antagonist